MKYDLFLDHQDFTYTHLQAIIWKCNGLALPNVIEKNAGDFLATSFENHRIDFPLVLNCKNVWDIDDHALDNLVALLKKKSRVLIFLNVGELIKYEQSGLDTILKNAKVEYHLDPENTFLITGNNTTFNIDDIRKNAIALKESMIRKIVGNCFVPYPETTENKRLSSTPFTANGEFDSRKIIFKPEYFIWINLFLSEMLESILIKSKSPLPFRLLTVSLRGSPFGASLGILKGITFDSIDHLGPKHKLFDVDFLDRNIASTNYVYVGDFTIGGTEIKIAQTYAQILGCKIDHALVIGSYLSSEVFKEEFDLEYLVSLKEFPKFILGV